MGTGWRRSVLIFDIYWRIAEAGAALAGFPVIEPAHFWVGVCKAVGSRQKTSRHKTQEKRKKDGRSVAEERIAVDFSEMKEAMAAMGLSPVKLRRALRAELGRKRGG